MKKKLFKTEFWKSLLSVTVLVIFIFLAAGSFDVLMFGLQVPETKVEKLGNGEYQETMYTVDQKRITTGLKDKYGNWTGDVSIKWTGGGYTEKCTMIEGRRWGMSTHIYPWGYANSPGGHYTEYYMYMDGIRMGQLKAANNMSENAAFMILGNKYPWFLFSLNAFGFDSLYIEAYMDTVLTLIEKNELYASKFDYYYGDILDSLTKTPYDSIISFNNDLSTLQGLEEMKNSELRLAIIDRYLADQNSTYDIIKTSYSNYLLMMNDSGVVSSDFEVFCDKMDSSMISYGALNTNDDFFCDSIDSRMFKALYGIISVEESASLLTKLTLKSLTVGHKKSDLAFLVKEFRSLISSNSPESTPKEVALIVLNDMLLRNYVDGDMMRRIFKEAYYKQANEIRFPVAATSFKNSNSSTSVDLSGYIIDNGGSEISSKGIAWATFYNPTIHEQTLASTSESDEFAVTLTGLKADTKYYARTYATNSNGTAYGNCISFIPNVAVSKETNSEPEKYLRIYPNPIDTKASFEFWMESSEQLSLTIYDLSGRIVMQKSPGILMKGENQIILDLTGLKNGLYTCRLMIGKSKMVGRFEIIHQ